MKRISEEKKNSINIFIYAFQGPSADWNYDFKRESTDVFCE